MDLKEERLKIGITQTEIAERAGVSLPTVCGWESGEGIAPKNIEKAAKAYGVKRAALAKHVAETARARRVARMREKEAAAAR